MPAEPTYSTPYWTTTATFPPFARLAEDLVTDVVGSSRLMMPLVSSACMNAAAV